jgi:tape measure domain-containing protein
LDIAELRALFTGDISGLQSAADDAKSILSEIQSAAESITNVTFTGDAAPLKEATDEATSLLSSFKEEATGLSTIELRGDASGITAAVDEGRSTLASFKEEATGLGVAELKADPAGVVSGVNEAVDALRIFKDEGATQDVVDLRADASGVVAGTDEAEAALRSYASEADSVDTVVLEADAEPVQQGAAEGSNALNQFGDAANQANDQTTILGDGIAGAGDRFYATSGHVRDTGAAAEETGGILGSLGDMFHTAASGAELFAGAAGLMAVFQGLEDVTDEISNFRLSMIQGQTVLTTLGFSADEARSHLEELDAFSKETGLEFPALEKADQRLIAVGVDADKTIPILKAAGDAAVAMGTGQQGIDQITNALERMYTTGEVSSRTLQLLVRQGVPIYQELADVLGTNVQGAMDAVKQKTVDIDTVMRAFEDGTASKFGPQIEAQEQTLSGSLSRLKENFISLISDGLQPMTDSLAVGASGLANFVARADVQESLHGMVEGFTEGAHILGEFVSEITGPAIAAIGDLASYLGPYLQPALDNFRAGWEALQPAIQPLAALLTGVVKGAFEAIAAIVGPVLVVALNAAGVAFRAIGEAVGWVGQQLQPFIPLIEQIGEVVGAVFAGTIVSALTDGAGSILEFIPLVGRIAPVFESAAETIESVFGPALTSISGLISQAVSGWSDVFSSIWSYISDAGSAAFSTLESVISGAMSIISSIFNAVWPVVVSAFNAALPIITEVASIVGGALAQAFAVLAPSAQSLANVLGPLLKPALEGIAIVVGVLVAGPLVLLGGILAGIALAASGLVLGIAKLVSGLGELPSLFSSIVSGAVSVASSFGSSLASAFSSAWETIKSVFSAGADALSPILSAAFDALVAIVQSTPLYQAIRLMWAVIEDIFNLGAQYLPPLLSAAWTQISSDAQSIWQSIRDYFQEWWDWLDQTLIEPTLSTIETALQTAWQFVSDTTTSIWDSIQSYLSSWWDTLSSTVSSYTSSIESVLEAAWQYVSDITSSVWDSIQSYLSSWWDYLSSLVSSGVSDLESVIESGWSWIESETEAAWEAIKSYIVNPIEEAYNTVTSLVSDMGSKIAGVLNSIGATNTASVISSWTGGSFAKGGYMEGTESYAMGGISMSFADGGSVGAGIPGFTTGRMVEWGEALAPGEREYFLTESPQHADRNLGLWQEYGERMGFSQQSFATGGMSFGYQNGQFFGPDANGNVNISETFNDSNQGTIQQSSGPGFATYSNTYSSQGGTTNINSGNTTTNNVSVGNSTGNSSNLEVCLPAAMWSAMQSDEYAGNYTQLLADFDPSLAQVYGPAPSSSPSSSSSAPSSSGGLSTQGGGSSFSSSFSGSGFQTINHSSSSNGSNQQIIGQIGSNMKSFASGGFDDSGGLSDFPHSVQFDPKPLAPYYWWGELTGQSEDDAISQVADSWNPLPLLQPIADWYDANYPDGFFGADDSSDTSSDSSYPGGSDDPAWYLPSHLLASGAEYVYDTASGSSDYAKGGIRSFADGGWDTGDDSGELAPVDQDVFWGPDQPVDYSTDDASLIDDSNVNATPWYSPAAWSSWGQPNSTQTSLDYWSGLWSPGGTTESPNGGLLDLSTYNGITGPASALAYALNDPAGAANDALNQIGDYGNQAGDTVSNWWDTATGLLGFARGGIRRFADGGYDDSPDEWQYDPSYDTAGGELAPFDPNVVSDSNDSELIGEDPNATAWYDPSAYYNDTSDINMIPFQAQLNYWSGLVQPVGQEKIATPDPNAPGGFSVNTEQKFIDNGVTDPYSALAYGYDIASQGASDAYNIVSGWLGYGRGGIRQSFATGGSAFGFQNGQFFGPDASGDVNVSQTFTDSTPASGGITAGASSTTGSTGGAIGAEEVVCLSFPPNMWQAMVTDDQNQNAQQLGIDFQPSQVSEVSPTSQMSGATPGVSNSSANALPPATGATGQQAPSGTGSSTSGAASSTSGTGQKTILERLFNTKTHQWQWMPVQAPQHPGATIFANWKPDPNSGKQQSAGGNLTGSNQQFAITPSVQISQIPGWEGQGSASANLPPPVQAVAVGSSSGFVPAAGGLGQQQISNQSVVPSSTPSTSSSTSSSSDTTTSPDSGNLSSSGVSDSIVATMKARAEQAVGSPYNYGTYGIYAGPDGYSCSGLWDWIVFGETGDLSSGGTYDWYNGMPGWEPGPGRVEVGVTLDSGDGWADPTHMAGDIDGTPYESDAYDGVSYGAFMGGAQNFPVVWHLSDAGATSAAMGGYVGSGSGTSLRSQAIAKLSPIESSLSSQISTMKFPGGLVGQGFQGVLAKMPQEIGNWAVSQLPAGGSRYTGNLDGSSGSPNSAVGPGSAPADQLGQWIQQGLAAGGYPPDWGAGLYWIDMHESGGIPDISNFEGSGASGLGQLMPDTFSAYEAPGHGNIFNPIDNTLAQANYIASTYGSPYALGLGSDNWQGYADGGIALSPHMGIVGEAGPEMMIPLDDNSAVSALIEAVAKTPQARAVSGSPISPADGGQTPSLEKKLQELIDTLQTEFQTTRTQGMPVKNTDDMAMAAAAAAHGAVRSPETSEHLDKVLAKGLSFYKQYLGQPV